MVQTNSMGTKHDLVGSVTIFDAGPQQQRMLQAAAEKAE